MTSGRLGMSLISIEDTLTLSEGPVHLFDLPSTLLASTLDVAPTPFWYVVCYPTALLILFVALLVVGARESKGYQRRDTNGWKAFRGTLVLLVLLVLLSAPYFGAFITGYHEANRPEIEFYVSEAPVDVVSFTFEADKVEDWEVVGFDGQTLLVYADRGMDEEMGTHWFYLRMIPIEADGGPGEVTNITPIENASYSLNPSVSLTTRVEDGRLSCYYTYVFGPLPGILTWKISTSDLEEWSNPIPVDGQPEPEGVLGMRNIRRFPCEWKSAGHSSGRLPDGITDGRMYEIGHHYLLRTSESGNLLMVEYVEDQMCYDETVAIYFAHKPKGGEWSELVLFGDISLVPRQMLEVAPGQFGIVYFGSLGYDHYNLQISLVDVSDLYDTIGPFQPSRGDGGPTID